MSDKPVTDEELQRTLNRFVIVLIVAIAVAIFGIGVFIGATVAS